MSLFVPLKLPLYVIQPFLQLLEVSFSRYVLPYFKFNCGKDLLLVAGQGGLLTHHIESCFILELQ